MSFCTHCGKDVGNARYCTQCGTKQERTVSQPAPAGNAPGSTQRLDRPVGGADSGTSPAESTTIYPLLPSAATGKSWAQPDSPRTAQMPQLPQKYGSAATGLEAVHPSPQGGTLKWIGIGIGAVVALALAVLVLGALVARHSSGSNVGSIEFGTGRDSKLNIQGKKDTFGRKEVITFVAHLSGAAGTKSITVELDRKSNGSETQVDRENASISDPRSDTYSNTFNPTGSGLLPGQYVLRIYRDSTKLAEGTFSVAG